MAAKASVATNPFQGIWIEVDTLVSFGEVLSRLRGLMGDASVPEVVALAKEAITQAEYVQKVEERFVGESGFTLFMRSIMAMAAEIWDQPAHRTLDSRQSADRHHDDPPGHHGRLVRSRGGPGDREGGRTGHDNRLRAPIVSHGHRGEPSATRSRKSARREVRRLDRQGDRRLKEDTQ
jgi:hypothetical protein